MQKAPRWRHKKWPHKRASIVDKLEENRWQQQVASPSLVSGRRIGQLLSSSWLERAAVLMSTVPHGQRSPPDVQAKMIVERAGCPIDTSQTCCGLSVLHLLLHASSTTGPRCQNCQEDAEWIVVFEGCTVYPKRIATDKTSADALNAVYTVYNSVRLVPGKAGCTVLHTAAAPEYSGFQSLPEDSHWWTRCWTASPPCRVCQHSVNLGRAKGCIETLDMAEVLWG